MFLYFSLFSPTMSIRRIGRLYLMLRVHLVIINVYIYTYQGWETIGKETNEKIWNEKKEQYTGRQKCMYLPLVTNLIKIIIKTLI